MRLFRDPSGQWSPNYDDCTLIAYSDNDSPLDSNRFMWKAGEGTLHLWLTNGAWQTVVEVDNDDNDWHTYGWQLNIITHELKLYFDGGLLGTWDAGDALAYGLIDFGDEINWNGDYIHRNDFTYFSMKEGPIPEPATVVLLALGGVVLLSRRRQEALSDPGS